MRIVWVVAMAAAMAFGQSEAPPATFEVASIKASTADSRSGMFPTPGRLTVGNRTLKQLIVEVYRLKNYQISGADGWMNSTSYDIAAKAAGPAKFLEMVAMLKPLLADRFQLKFHRETKELPGYWLVVGKNGPKIQKPAPSDTTQGWLRNGNHSIEAHKMAIGQLVFFLGGEIQRPLIDKTGLEGDYDFKLQWSDERAASPADAALAPADVEKPSLLAAVQEQLGLKLELHTGPVEILVIDHAEKPSLN